MITETSKREDLVDKMIATAIIEESTRIQKRPGRNCQ